MLRNDRKWDKVRVPLVVCGERRFPDPFSRLMSGCAGGGVLAKAADSYPVKRLSQTLLQLGEQRVQRTF